jgi:hypothetical protein
MQMEENYSPFVINSRMPLNEALNAYSDQISYITLKDGTNIEVYHDNQNFRQRPEMGYNNQIQSPNEYEFVEENIIETSPNANYQQSPMNYPGPFRGKGLKKSLGTTLRKTVLKSMTGKEPEANVPSEQKLRYFNPNKGNRSLNDIITFTENNEYLQCANCKKFFISDEKEDENKDQANNQPIQNENQNQNIPEQNQQFAQVTPVKKDQNKHYQPYSGQQSPPSQQFQPYQNISQFYPQQGYPSQHHHHQNQKQNIPMGFPPMPNQYQQQFYPQQGHHHQKQPQQYYQQIPVPQQYQNQRGVQKGYGIQGSYLAQNAPMSAQFRGQNNYVFRARKKEVNRYDSNNDRYINYTSEENYFYPASAKKRGSNRKLVFECPIHKKLIHNTSSNNVNRNLSYGYKKSYSNAPESGYTDNNLSEYINANDMGMNNIGYYKYPQQERKYMIPTGYGTKKVNQKMVYVDMGNDEYNDY